LSASHLRWLVSSHKPKHEYISPASPAVEELVLNIKGNEWQKFRDKERKQLVEMCFRYWRSRGFPYYKLSDADIKREYSRLTTVSKERILLGEEIQISRVGTQLANYFHPQIWSVRPRGRRSPLQCFNNDEELRRLIQRAFKVCPDRSSVNENNLRGMLRTFNGTGCVSNFRPTAAKAIYEQYSRDGDIVVDFSSGYGGRLLGCLPLIRHYIGIDPCREQITGLRNMKARLQRLAKVEATASIHHTCAEDFLPRLDSNSVSLVFSSPPYFNTERYSEEPSQSFIRYPGYEEWLEKFIRKVIAESSRILKPRGYLVLNVADINGYNLTRDVRRVASAYLKLTKILKLRLSHLPYFREQSEEKYKYEPVFVFRKTGSRSQG
jgi:tRNA1(Val) A37 N6-methylase TrmN6